MSEKKREPLLSDTDIAEAVGGWWTSNPDAISFGKCQAVRDHYERLIDEGNLRVVEEVAQEERDSFVHCSGCELSYPWEADAWIGTINYCPGCGGKIKR